MQSGIVVTLGVDVEITIVPGQDYSPSAAMWSAVRFFANEINMADDVTNSSTNPKMETFRSSSGDFEDSFLRDFSRRSFLNHLYLWREARILWYRPQNHKNAMSKTHIVGRSLFEFHVWRKNRNTVPLSAVWWLVKFSQMKTNNSLLEQVWSLWYRTTCFIIENKILLTFWLSECVFSKSCDFV